MIVFFGPFSLAVQGEFNVAVLPYFSTLHSLSTLRSMRKKGFDKYEDVLGTTSVIPEMDVNIKL